VKNVARLWRRELNSILETEASACSAADRRAAYAKLAHAMRRNPSLVAGLRAEGRRILDSRAEVLQGIEWLAIRFPDRNAEELFDRAINVALAHCLDLELQAKTRDTGKKTRVATPRVDINEAFCKHLAKKRRQPQSINAEAVRWLFRECKIKTEEREDMSEKERRLVQSVARAGQRWSKANLPE